MLALVVLGVGAAQAASVPGPANGYGTAQAQASSLGSVYIEVDGQFYDVDASQVPVAIYEPIGTSDYAWVISGAVMSSCASASPFGNGNVFLIYGYTDPALPIQSASYQFVINAFGSASLFTVTTLPGNTACNYAIPRPAVFDDIFHDGFE